MDEDEVADEEAAEDEVEVHGFGRDAGQQRGEGDGDEGYSARKAVRWRWWKRWRGSRPVCWRGSLASWRASRRRSAT